MTDKSKSKMISMGGLWLKKSASGHFFMVGNIGFNGKIFVFKNKDKSKDTAPDYFIYFAPNEERTETAQEEENTEPPF